MPACAAIPAAKDHLRPYKSPSIARDAERERGDVRPAVGPCTTRVHRNPGSLDNVVRAESD